MSTEARRDGFVAMALILVLATCPARADDGIFEGSGGSVSLSRSEHIRMVAEEVVFDLTTPDVIRVACLFVVVNEGPADTLLLGFPDYWPATDDDSQRADGRSAISGLVVMVDGVPVTTTAVPAAEAPTILGDRTRGTAWNVAHVWPCAFAPGQVRVLRTEYCHGYSAYIHASHVLNYVLRTGASWAGPIGKVVARIIPGEMRVKLRSNPQSWERAGEQYVWTAADLEPTEDIWVGLAHPAQFARHLVSNWRWSVGADGPDAARRALRESGTLQDSRPDFLTEVCEALGDSLPDLRAVIVEFR